MTNLHMANSPIFSMSGIPSFRKSKREGFSSYPNAHFEHSTARPHRALSSEMYASLHHHKGRSRVPAHGGLLHRAAFARANVRPTPSTVDKSQSRAQESPAAASNQIAHRAPAPTPRRGRSARRWSG